MDPRAIEYHQHTPKQPQRHHVDIECALHLKFGLEPGRNKKVASAIVRLLKEMVLKGDIEPFDAIAARGLSGLLLVPIVAMRMNRTMLIVRKGEQCHSGRTVEGDHGARTYVIIDDFISSGATVAETTNAIAESVPLARCVGMVTYNNLLDEDGPRTSYRGRFERGFYSPLRLREYSPAIKHQETRIVNRAAFLQSRGLKLLAEKECKKRNRRDEVQKDYYSYSQYDI